VDDSLVPFFKPRGIVVIGVSTSEGKLGHGIARNLTNCGFPGPIHFVAQRGGSLFGRPVHTDLAQVPDPVDLAILAVPPAATPDVLRTCGSRAIPAAIIVSAGFREAGDEGARLEALCLDIAHSQRIRLLGPNCIGIIDTHLPLDTTFLQPPMPPKGNIGFVSHSGAYCAAIIDWARGQGFGFSQVASVGNQADVTEVEMLAAVGADPNTNVIVLYLEGVSDGRRLVAIARELTPRKAVIALKVGRSEFGHRAAASHTGALAGSDRAYDAAFENCGVLRASTSAEMFDWARAIALCPAPAGNRVAILTNAGGPGVVAADAVALNGLSMAVLGEKTRRDLTDILPPSASVRNPIDMLASATPGVYAESLQTIAKDGGVDGVILILPPPPMFRAEEVAAAVLPVIRAAGKPVLVTLMGSALTAVAHDEFTAAHVPVYAFPEAAVSGFAALVRRTAPLSSTLADLLPPQVSPTIETLDSMSAEDLMASCGIASARSALARSASEAVTAARELELPVVLKVVSADIPHKSDADGVLMHLQSEREVSEGYERLLRQVRARRPEARIEAVQVQHEIAGGADVILGVVRDPDFGPLLMFGSGGIEVEAMQDVAFALAPVSDEGAGRLIRRTWAGRRLAGYRSVAPADEEAVVNALVRLSWLAHQHPELAEIEVNPLRVQPAGRGAYALDVRIRLTDATPANQPIGTRTVA
jgi:acetyltransferase